MKSFGIVRRGLGEFIIKLCISSSSSGGENPQKAASSCDRGGGCSRSGQPLDEGGSSEVNTAPKIGKTTTHLLVAEVWYH